MNHTIQVVCATGPESWRETIWRLVGWCPKILMHFIDYLILTFSSVLNVEKSTSTLAPKGRVDPIVLRRCQLSDV